MTRRFVHIGNGVHVNYCVFLWLLQIYRLWKHLRLGYHEYHSRICVHLVAQARLFFYVSFRLSSKPDFLSGQKVIFTCYIRNCIRLWEGLVMKTAWFSTSIVYFKKNSIYGFKQKYVKMRNAEALTYKHFLTKIRHFSRNLLKNKIKLFENTKYLQKNSAFINHISTRKCVGNIEKKLIGPIGIRTQYPLEPFSWHVGTLDRSATWQLHNYCYNFDLFEFLLLYQL